MSVLIRPYQDSDASKVSALWGKVWPTPQAHNRPEVVIRSKLEVGDGLFWVAAKAGSKDSRPTGTDAIIGTVMAGYDGHRGWIYCLCVDEEQRKAGVGTLLMQAGEEALRDLGCTKVNLQIRPDDKVAAGFYRALGYGVEERVSMGKLL